MRICTVLIALSCFAVTGPSCAQTDKYFAQRERMVKEQIQSRGIDDSVVLDAMLKVERHHFVPIANRRFAYNDYPLPIGFDQTISQPYIVAYMTELLDLKKTDQVLEIGTGSGYQAAVLGEIVSKVYTIEIVEELHTLATSQLKKLGYKNVFTRLGDGYNGWPETAPFDAIIVTAAPPEIPEPLIRQLKEGGRMIIPVGPAYAVQKLILLKKMGSKILSEELIPVRFVPFTRYK